MSSEELLQRNYLNESEKIGSWSFYNIGATNLSALKNAQIIPNRDYKEFEKRKPDGIIVDKQKVIAIIENKNIKDFKNTKQKLKATLQGFEVAQVLGAKLVIATDTTETIWINALNGEEIKDENGNKLNIVFDPKSSDVEKLIRKIVDCIRIDK